MPNIATVFKTEITRLARRELKIETGALKKSANHCRSDIAALKKRVAELETLVSRLSKVASKAATPAPSPEVSPATGNLRFRVKGFQTLRSKLGLSAAEMGRLLRVSGPTIYNWEAGKSRPRGAQLVAIGVLRGLGKREVMALLESSPA